MKKKIALIDGNALCHVVKHATKELSFNGSSTGVLFGLIRKLFNIQEKIFANQYLFCWDDSEVLERKMIYPQYKCNRSAQKEEEKKLNSIAIPQFNIARLFMLPSIGWKNHFIYPGIESDDIIAKLIEQHKADYDFIIISRDNDFYQLLDGEAVIMFDPVKFSYTTERSFKEKSQISKDKWAFVKAISGCSGDGVAGVSGIGSATAIKFLKNELNKKSKKFQDIVNNEETIINNLRLVMLPWETTPEFEFINDELSKEMFIKICMEYGFKSYLAEGLQDKFKDLFIDAQE